MTLDDLKTDWQSLDEKVRATQRISNQVVLSLMRDRSKSTLANMQRQLEHIALFFTALLLLFTAILLGNPFDYTHWFDYVPAVLYALLVANALRIVWQEYVAIRHVALTNNNLRESLQTVIRLHERHLLTMNKVWKFSLLAGFLLSLSLVSRNFGEYSWLKLVGVITGQLVTLLAMYTVARWLFGQLPDAHLTALRAYYSELEEEE